MKSGRSDNGEKHWGVLLLRLVLAYWVFAPLCLLVAMGPFTMSAFNPFDIVALLVLFFGGIFIAIGLFTRISSLVLFFYFLAANFLFPGMTAFHVSEALMLLVLFLTGPGAFSFDRSIFKKI